MPSIKIHPPSQVLLPFPTASGNALPEVLHTPSGLALLEIQGTIHFPTSTQPLTQVGKLVFPLYNPTLNGSEDMRWMKRVYLYIGKGQRMTGECKKLGKPIAVMRRREKKDAVDDDDDDAGATMVGIERAAAVEEAEQTEELEIVQVIKYKLLFSARPEPISGIMETG